MKYGVFGGTFDPFTAGHYEIVRKVLADNIVDKVIVIPTIVNYYRKDKSLLFTINERKAIIQKWFAGFENVMLDFNEFDIALHAKLYYSDPKEIHNRRYIHMLEDVIDRSRKSDSDVYYTIVGGDSWNNLNKWHKWEQLFEMSRFIVVRRDEEKLKTWSIVEPKGYNKSGFVPMIGISIDPMFAKVSATKIREQILKRSRNESKIPYDVYIDSINRYKETLDCTI